MHVRLEARVPELRRRPPREDGAEVARDLERVLEAEPVAVLFRSVGGEGRGGAARRYNVRASEGDEPQQVDEAARERAVVRGLHNASRVEIRIGSL